MSEKYDNDPEAITRPDTVPAALRFAEASDIASGVEHRVPRELKPYPRLPELPPPPSDEMTVVDPPLRRISMAVPRVEPTPPPPAPSTELASGPRTVSTVPPPSRARRKLEGAVPLPERSGPRHATPLPSRQSPLPRYPSPIPTVAAPPRVQRNFWPLVVGLVLTAFGSALVGTTLGNGSFERAAERVFSSPAATTAPAPLVTATLEAPLPAPSSKPAPEPPRASEAPTVRVEDLPLAKDDASKTKGKRTPATRRRAPAKTVRP